MLKNYFKIAWRNIVKNKFYSGINILGLSVGIAFTLLIGAYVWGELQVNKNLKNADRQYIIKSIWKDPAMGFDLSTLGPLAKELKDRYPDLVANYYRYDGITSNISKGTKSFRENIQIGDSTILNMYGFSLLHGNPKTALHQPYTVVITPEAAIKYFGKTDVLGETITIENFSGSRHDFVITGVLQKLSPNSVTQLADLYPGNFYVSTDNLSFFGRNMVWQNIFIVNYIELQEGVTPKELEKPIQYLVKQNTDARTVDNLKIELTPLKQYYLTANNGLVKTMLYSLSAIALFILMMAIINFVNMSVSRSATRLKEIGVRKVMGGLKLQLIIQFLTESIILVGFATVFAFIIFMLVQNIFASIVGKPIPSLNTFPVYFLFFPLLLIFIVGFIAGIYPAFVLSSVKSVDSIKGKLNTVKDKIMLRKSLIAFQFGTAAVVLIGAVIVTQQVNLFFGKNLGYNKDYIISAQVSRNWTPEGVRKIETLRRQFATMPQVSNATISYEVPDGNNSGNAFVFKDGADSTNAITTQVLYTDENYASTYGISMAAGVFYTENGIITDPEKVVINEAESKALGWENPHDALGKKIRFPGGGNSVTIVGVTKDFHFESMQKVILPATFLHVQLTNTFRFLSFKLKPGNIGQSIVALQQKWSALMPGVPFEYKFMDDTLTNLYKSEIQLKKASYVATTLAIIIVLVGVIGLISLSIQKRTKEIGIRKVLGSSIAGIISLFIKEFLVVILIGGLIACPLAYMIMHSWLQDYAYRINITISPFLFSVCCLGIITALVICAQTIKAALANPVKALRSE